MKEATEEEDDEDFAHKLPCLVSQDWLSGSGLYLRA